MRRNLSRSFTCANVVVGGVLQPARRAADHGHLPVGQGPGTGPPRHRPRGCSPGCAPRRHAVRTCRIKEIAGDGIATGGLHGRASDRYSGLRL